MADDYKEVKELSAFYLLSSRSLVMDFAIHLLETM